MDGAAAEDYMSQKPSAPALCRRAFVNMASEAGKKHGDGIDQGIADPRCQQDGEDKKPAPISFGFSKTSSKFKTSSNLNESEKEERDYLTGVEEKELKSTKPVEQKKELVIPLIIKNRWVRQEKPKKEPLGSKDCPPSQEQDSVESQAVKELVEESRRQLDQWKNGTQEGLDLTIPLLMQNQVPQGFEDGDRVRVDLRPESSTDADYESVPVEAYGLAMLKGMGWKEDEGIGRTFKQVVKPIEHQLRPKGLGLGADRSALKDLEPSGPRRPPKPGEDRSQEEMVLAPGASVLLEAGAHKEHYGKVEGVDPDNARVMVKLAIGGKIVTVSQYNIRLVGRKEYDRNAKDLSRHSKAHMEKEREKKKKREERAERNEQQQREERAERNEQQQKSKEKKDKRKHTDSREKTPPAKLPRQEPSTPCWLQRDLRVRFINKTFKGGKYYNSKMTVEDVLTPRTCVCRTEEGRLLDGVKQEMLETMVPKGESDCIMVVLGEHRGQVGRILQRDKERCRAMVQLDRHEEKIYTLDYDSICHYVGGGCV